VWIWLGVDSSELETVRKDYDTLKEHMDAARSGRSQSDATVLELQATVARLKNELSRLQVRHCSAYNCLAAAMFWVVGLRGIHMTPRHCLAPPNGTALTDTT